MAKNIFANNMFANDMDDFSLDNLNDLFSVEPESDCPNANKVLETNIHETVQESAVKTDAADNDISESVKAKTKLRKPSKNKPNDSEIIIVDMDVHIIPEISVNCNTEITHTENECSDPGIKPTDSEPGSQSDPVKDTLTPSHVKPTNHEHNNVHTDAYISEKRGVPDRVEHQDPHDTDHDHDSKETPEKEHSPELSGQDAELYEALQYTIEKPLKLTDLIRERREDCKAEKHPTKFTDEDLGVFVYQKNKKEATKEPEKPHAPEDVEWPSDQDNAPTLTSTSSIVTNESHATANDFSRTPAEHARKSWHDPYDEKAKHNQIKNNQIVTDLADAIYELVSTLRMVEKSVKPATRKDLIGTRQSAINIHNKLREKNAVFNERIGRNVRLLINAVQTDIRVHELHKLPNVYFALKDCLDDIYAIIGNPYELDEGSSLKY